MSKAPQSGVFLSSQVCFCKQRHCRCIRYIHDDCSDRGRSRYRALKPSVDPGNILARLCFYTPLRRASCGSISPSSGLLLWLVSDSFFRSTSELTRDYNSMGLAVFYLIISFMTNKYAFFVLRSISAIMAVMTIPSSINMISKSYPTKSLLYSY